MTNLNEREQIIQIIKDYFAKTNVKRVSLFGSWARGDATLESDIDLLMELNEPIGYLKIIQHKHALEKETQHKVDLLTPNAVSHRIQPFIEKDAILIYEHS